MQEKNILLCFLALPLRHKLAAAGIAVAIASGFFFWSRHGAGRPTTTAVVSFDASAARQVEPAAMHAKEPAVALAQSILNDETVRGLARRAGVKSDVAEFRSHLEMTQPSAHSLHVNFHGLERETSVDVANAIANLLVAWRPVAAVAPPAPVSSVPVPSASTVVASPHPHTRSLRGRPDEIHNLEAQLAAIDQKLSALSTAASQVNAPQKAAGTARLSSADEEQRRVLEAQLSAAQKKLGDLRARYTDEYPDVEAAKENIAEIQQTIASLRPVTKEAEQAAASSKLEAVSYEGSELRQERARLVEAIAGEKRREARLQGRAASPAHESPASRQAASSQPQPAPVLPPENPVAALILQSPFTLARLATYDEPGSWWHGVLAGILCGFLYLSSAVWRYLPIAGSVASAPLALNGDAGVEAAKLADAPTDLAGWEKEIKRALAETEIGRQEEPLLARQEAVNGHGESVTVEQQVIVHGPELKGQLHYDEVSEAIRAKAKQEPNSWMAHTEEARVALAGGDYDTAIKEIKLASTVAPEKMRPQLDKIITQLDRNISVKQRAAFG